MVNGWRKQQQLQEVFKKKGHKHMQWQASLQQEVVEDSDAMVVMKDDADL
jgi:hypothetical protein